MQYLGHKHSLDLVLGCLGGMMRKRSVKVNMKVGLPRGTKARPMSVPE